MRHLTSAGRIFGARRAIIVASLLVVLLAVGLVMHGCSSKGTPEGQAQDGTSAAESRATPVAVVTAMRSDIEDALEVTGTAEASDEVDVVAEASGKVARVYADVGDYVRRGTTLVRVDTQVAAAQRDQAAAGVQSARASLNQAEESLDLTTATTASTVRQAEVGVSVAQERLEQARASARLVESQVNSAIDQARTGVSAAEAQLADVKAGAREQERRQAEAQVRQAKASLDLAEQNYNRYHGLLEGGVVSQQQFDQYNTQYKLAQQTYQQAVEQLSLVEEGPRSEQVRLAELGVEQAKQRLAQAQANVTQIEVARQEVRAAQEGVRQAQEQLTAAIAGRGQVAVQERLVASARAGVDQAQAGERVTAVQLSKHAVHSPVSGLVAMRMVDAGEGAMPGTPVMRIVQIDPIRVDAIVGELDVDRVGKGDVGLVRFDGLAGRDYRGAVTDIHPQAVPGSRNFIVRVEVPNGDGAIKPGMFARISLVFGTREDVVVVQRDAIVERGPKRFVYAVADGKIEVREVTLGVAEDSVVEVTDGVQPGDVLVVMGQDQLADGQAVVPRERSELTGEGATEAEAEAPTRPDPDAEPAPAPPDAGADGTT